MQYNLLNKIDSPENLRDLDENQLPQLASELRSYLLNCVSQSSGHLASGLGVVELTIALHYVFNTPFDNLIWDVGHQAYPHKILTGRRERILSIRQQGGLHPFPWREESIFDVLSVGHSSTSISAGLGLAFASELENKNRKTICVIGDGAITAGMAFEALNHAGVLHNDMLVILNDNEMSISENVGALNNYLARMFSGNFYNKFRNGGKKIANKMPCIKNFMKKSEEHLKGVMLHPQSTLFEQLGFNYIGPIDGHNLDELIKTLRNMKELQGPQFLHIKTIKGKGYKLAEEDPISYHSVPKFDPTKQNLQNEKEAKTYSNIFGNWLCDKAQNDAKLMAITPAMREGSGMVEFSKKFPKQYFDVAIAEQHAVTFACGLAIAGLKPVVAIYSTFLQRAYDQLIHDVAIQNLTVVFAVDRAGIVGADGQTHQGAFDLSFARCIPNLTIMTPSDESEMYQMLNLAYSLNSPALVRYPKGNVKGLEIVKNHKLKLGKGKIVQAGAKVAILNFGTFLDEAIKVAQKHNFTVIDMRFVKPLDEELILNISKQHKLLVTIEENAILGGAGSAVGEFLQANEIVKPVLNLGIPDHFIEPASQEQAYDEIGLTASKIENRILQRLKNLV